MNDYAIKRNGLGYSGEASTISILKIAGRDIWPARYGSHYDILVDGKVRCEIKTAAPRKELHPPKDSGSQREKAPFWRFNLHRGGKMFMESIDCYILRFEGVPFCKNSFHALILSGDAGTKTVQFSFRQMLKGEIAKYVEAFEKFRDTGELPAASNGAKP